MSSFWTWAGAGLLGGGLSALGGILGAGSQRTASNQARDMMLQNAIQGQRNLGSLLYGKGYWSGFAADPTAKQYGLYQSESPVTTIVQHRPDQPDPNSILGRQTALGDLYQQRSGGIQQGFDSGMTGLQNQYRGAEGLASQFGQGGEALIDQETARALKAANQMSAANLAARGFGTSTAAASQASQNQLNAARQAATQKLGLRQQALDRVLGVRGQAAAAQNQNIGRRADLQGNLLNNLMLYRQQPIQTELNAQMSNVMNPLLGQNFQNQFSGVSPMGTGLANVGNALGVLGGYGMMANSGQGGGYNPFSLYGGQMDQMRQSYGG